MNIDRVCIKGLFNCFDHDLQFQAGERIMFISSPNGFGKTTTLNLINALFNHAPNSLVRAPFQKLDVSFNDGGHLIAEKLPVNESGYGDDLPVKLTYNRDGTHETFSPARVVIDKNHPEILIEAIEDFIPVLNQVGHDQWYDTETGAKLSLADVLEIYPNDLPAELLPEVSPVPDWLREIKQSIKVHLVDTKRLSRISQYWRHGRSIYTTHTINHYFQELASHIRDSIIEYGKLSQNLDISFPIRLITGHQALNDSVQNLRDELEAIDRRRSELENTGLLKEAPHSPRVPNLELLDKAQRVGLAVYVQDAKEKLAVFDDLYGRINTFTKIANSRFIRKQVAVSADGMSVTQRDGTALDMEKLSAGEQHELVMLYNLLFRVSKNSLILIDEPERSHHVTWQEKWLGDIEQIAGHSDFHAIVATHSPEIIGNRWSLVVELQNQDNS